MLNRNVTRAIYDSTEITNATNILSSGETAFVFATTEALYLGYRGKFASRYFDFGTANTNTSSLVVEYWNGSAWVEVDDLVDQTIGMSQSGFISWVNNSDWSVKGQAGIDLDIELYFIKITTDADFSAGTTLKSVSDIYCDAGDLRYYYPELITDTRYLPSGRTDFLEQFQAAKDLTVLKLKQRKVISEESQIIDINYVNIAAVHATAYIIFGGIATSDEIRAMRDDAFGAFISEIQQTNLGTDQNEDGIVSSAERRDIANTFIRRR